MNAALAALVALLAQLALLALASASPSSCSSFASRCAVVPGTGASSAVGAGSGGLRRVAAGTASYFYLDVRFFPWFFSFLLFLFPIKVTYQILHSTHFSPHSA